MRTNLDAYRAMSLSSLIVRFGLIGAAAGLVAWLLVLAARLLFEADGPSGLSLLLAIPRGALYAIILAVILHTYWKKHRGKSDSSRR
jgi:putative flippase GtrA